jgi:DNA polymerase III delta prime subunit
MARSTTSFQIAPANLWLGPHDTLVKAIEEKVQTLWCLQGGCRQCMLCQRISAHQHHMMLWLTPEKQYTLEELEVIHETIALALEPGQQFFIIITRADLLPPACANRLLKAVEEPPSGYFFFLLSERREGVLPTLRSRCHSYSWYNNQEMITHQALFSFFTSAPIKNPIEFLKELETSKITEPECNALLDHILAYWINSYKTALATHSTQQEHEAEENITVLKKALEMPPMPGSSKIFLKNLFVMLNR